MGIQSLIQALVCNIDTGCTAGLTYKVSAGAPAAQFTNLYFIKPYSQFRLKKINDLHKISLNKIDNQFNWYTFVDHKKL